MAFQIFGSASSTDVDIVVFVDEIHSTKENADYCKALKSKLQQQYSFEKPLNVNIACLGEGIITAVHKGTIDELNNSLYFTYDLHQQYFPQQIKALLPRDLTLKKQRCIRKILSFLTRTHQRQAVKLALQGDYITRVNYLKTLQLSEFTDFGKKGNLIEFKKAVAFQLTQTIALSEGKELYTKETLIQAFPQVEPHLMRKPYADIKILEELILSFKF